MTNLDIKNILANSICGLDEHGFSKCNILLENKIILPEKEPKVCSEYLMRTPEINIFQNNKYTIVDFIFLVNESIELRHFWSLLENFGKIKNSYDPTKNELPMTFLTIVPKDDNQHFLSLISPVFWTLTNKNVEDSKPTVIRLVFENEDLIVSVAEDIAEEEKDSIK